MDGIGGSLINNVPNTLRRLCKLKTPTYSYTVFQFGIAGLLNIFIKVSRAYILSNRLSFTFPVLWNSTDISVSGDCLRVHIFVCLGNVKTLTFFKCYGHGGFHLLTKNNLFNAMRNEKNYIKLFVTNRCVSITMNQMSGTKF